MDGKQLKFVCEHAGNGLLPVLSMLHVYDNEHGERRCQAQNGRYAVDIPTDLPECTVSAARLVAAWQACKGEPQAQVNDANLTIKAGRVRARIPLSNAGDYPRAKPDERTLDTPCGVAKLFARLEPFVATDASRPWATSVCLAGEYAYATNNVVLARVPFPGLLPHPVNVPQAVFEAISALGEPVGLGYTGNTVTFHFDGGAWVQTTLISGDWPTATVDGLMAQVGDSWEVPHPDLGMILATAAKLADSRHPIVQFNGDGLKLLDDAFEADELLPVPEDGKVNARMAALVFEFADGVQWHTPRRDVHAFRVEDIVGVFGGHR